MLPSTPPADQGISLLDAQLALGELCGMDTVFVCWDAPLVLMELQLAVPAIQVIDLSHNPILFNLLDQFAKQKGVPCTLRRDPGLSLPEVVLLLTGGQVNIRKHGDLQRRLELLDGL